MTPKPVATSPGNGALASALRALADVLEAQASNTSATADELVDVRACGLERRAVDKLIAAGELRAVRIGRRLYAKKSALVALVDVLPPVTKIERARPDHDEQDDEVDARVLRLIGPGEGR